jgi:hypothetical protein
MTIHFSIKFKDDPHTYHGEFESTYRNLTEIAIENIKKRARVEVSKLLEREQKAGADITRYELYTHNRPKEAIGYGGDGSEIEIFRFEKGKGKQIKQ